MCACVCVRVCVCVSEYDFECGHGLVSLCNVHEWFLPKVFSPPSPFPLPSFSLYPFVSSKVFLPSPSTGVGRSEIRIPSQVPRVSVCVCVCVHACV